MNNYKTLGIGFLLPPLLLITALLTIHQQYGVLLFHTLAEFFSIIVGVLMLVIVWHTRHFTRNDFLVYLGIGYFWIALLDGLHTITFHGMPFMHIEDGVVAIHIWIYTRLLEGMLLLSSVLFLHRRLNALLMFSGCAALALLTISASAGLEVPVLLTPEGLAPLKVYAEYLAMALFSLAIYLYVLNRKQLPSEVLYFLIAAMLLTIFSELSFTFYPDFTSPAFVIGHIFKLLSFWMIYQGIVRTTLIQPFKMLAQGANTYDAIPYPAVIVNQQGAILQVNRATEIQYVKQARELIRQPIHALFHNRVIATEDCELCRAIHQGQGIDSREVYLPERGRWCLTSIAPVGTEGDVKVMVQYFTDITERKNTEEYLRESEARFRRLFEYTDAIAVQGFSRDRRVTYWNPASERLYGYSAQHATGRLLEELIIPKEMVEVVKELIDNWLDKEISIPSSEMTLVRADGSPVTIYTSHVMFHKPNGEREMYCIDIDLTEFKRVEHALRVQEERLSHILNTLPYGVQENDIRGIITYSNPARHRILGMAPGELIGTYIWENETGEERQQKLRDYLDYMVKEQPKPEPYRSQNTTKDGREITVEVVWDYQRNSQGELTGFISVISDITEQVQAEEQIRTLSLALEQSPVSVMLTDTQMQIEYVNNAFEWLTGYAADEVIGQHPRTLEIDIPPRFQFTSLVKAIGQGSQWEGEIQSRRKNGELLWEYARISPVVDNTGKIRHYLAIKEDITMRKIQEEKILHQAHFDTLTNLPNRFLSLDRLNQLLNEARRYRNLVAVMFLDLDDFKLINDTLGHEVGDKLLIEAAERLRSLVRGQDTVGRLGGDEFIVLLGGLANASSAHTVAENLLNRFRDAFRVGGRELVLTVSIGIAFYPADGENASELLRNADSAMYHSKELGRNTYSFFTHTMNRDITRRLALEEQMHGALDRNELSLVYQPQIELQSGKIIGVEVLLRWKNPALGDVPPIEFIPIAEQNGQILSLGKFLLTEVLSLTAHWQLEFNPEFRVAVNLSPLQFRDPELVNFIVQAIRLSNVASRSLELEITEGVLLSGHTYINEALTALNSIGVSIALDDFGTGYSSLNYLRNYPFNMLKIDQSFMQDITEDSDDRGLVNAIVAMAHGLGMEVVAEGVETNEQYDYLRKLGCDYAQGYLFSKPVSADQITEMLAKGVSWGKT